jgi:large subunit ribosomal protein L29
MKANELRKKSDEELRGILEERRKKLHQLRTDLVGGKVKNVREIRKVKKEIAQILTILNERKLNKK